MAAYLASPLQSLDSVTQGFEGFLVDACGRLPHEIDVACLTPTNETRELLKETLIRGAWPVQRLNVLVQLVAQVLEPLGFPGPLLRLMGRQALECLTELLDYLQLARFVGVQLQTKAPEVKLVQAGVYHRERCHLLCYEQDRFAIGQGLGNHVGNGL